MKLLQRTFALILALVMCLALLSACGRKNDPVATPRPSAENSDIETPASPTATAEPSATPAATAEPSAAPTEEPAPTATPKPTPKPTAKPTVPVTTPTPKPTVKPTAAPSPSPVQPSPTTPPTPEAGQVDLKAFYDAANATYDMSNQSDMDTATLDAFYAGLTAISAKQLIAKMPMISAAVSEIVLIQCENAADVETVKAIFATRKQAQVDGGAWYPSSIETWGKAQIVTNGNYVMLVAHESAADIADSFNALFK